MRAWATLSFVPVLILPVLAGQNGSAPPAASVDANVVYATRADLSLVMDVHRPPQPNGFGVVLVPGRAWAGLTAAAGKPVKDTNPQVGVFLPPLLAAGYTVAVVEHRGAPRFHYPSQVDDVARAVRFVRHNATRYGIDARRLGAVGYSSGANLVAMLGVRANPVEGGGSDATDRESARLQCVVAGGTPADLSAPSVSEAYQLLTAYVGVPVAEPAARSADVQARLRDASPVTHVSADDAPMLLFHGADDQLVPIANARALAAALTRAGVSATMLEMASSGHWPLPAAELPRVLAEMVRWMDGCLERSVIGRR
jgi:acetyl esterase/lipase